MEEDLRNRTMAELLGRLSRETTLLVRQEIDLAKAELAERGKAAGAGVAGIGAGALLGLGAFGAITAAFILLLALVMSPWLAALVVAVVYGIAAAVLALTGKKKIEEAAPFAPETI